MSSEDQNAASAAALLKATEKSNYYKWNEFTSTRAEELKSLGVDFTPKPICSPANGSDMSGTPTPSTTCAHTPGGGSSATGEGFSPKPAGSVWNAAGTWEERDITEPARAALYEVLSFFTTDINVGGITGTVSLSSPSVDHDGKITVVFTRGKVKPGFNLDVSASYTFNGTTTGKVTLVDFSDTEGPDMFSRLKVTVSSNGLSSAATTASSPAATGNSNEGGGGNGASFTNDVVAKQMKEALTPKLRERLRDWLEVVRAL